MCTVQPVCLITLRRARQRKGKEINMKMNLSTGAKSEKRFVCLFVCHIPPFHHVLPVKVWPLHSDRIQVSMWKSGPSRRHMNEKIFLSSDVLLCGSSL